MIDIIDGHQYLVRNQERSYTYWCLQTAPFDTHYLVEIIPLDLATRAPELQAHVAALVEAVKEHIADGLVIDALCGAGLGDTIEALSAALEPFALDNE